MDVISETMQRRTYMNGHSSWHTSVPPEVAVTSN